MSDKLNYPTLSRPQIGDFGPQSPTNVEYINDEIRHRNWIIEQRKKRNKPSEFIRDILYGRVLTPEFSILIKHEKPIKIPTKIDLLKMKIAKFILWLANLIGEKNV